MNIEYLAGVVSLIAYEYDIIPKSWIVIISTIFLLLWLLNMEYLDHKVGLVKKYAALMKLLQKHSRIQEIEITMKGWNPNSPQSHIDALKYFNETKPKLDIKFNNLNTKLNKISVCRYYILITNSNIIGIEFFELVSDIKIFYDYFSRPMNLKFISVLEESQIEFPEMKKAMKSNLLERMNDT